MLLTRIYLHQFRNFQSSIFDISRTVTLIIGPNAKGKTSLLEGIMTAVYCSGFRESREAELLMWEKNQALVETIFMREQDAVRFQINMSRIGERVKKELYINKATSTYRNYRSMQTSVVLFAPEQIEIITGSPSKRRNYFDIVLGSQDAQYRKCLRNYEEALRKRNKLLETYQSTSQLYEQIDFWNQFLIEQAAYITKKRHEYCEFLNSNPYVSETRFEIVYKSDRFDSARLQSYFNDEVRLRRSLIGPQKDEFLINLLKAQKENVHLFGSRSQQRIAVFWLKVNELKYFENITKVRPILLLDDIFSELDIRNRKLVMDIVSKYQTIATTTEEEVRDLLPLKVAEIRL